MSFPWRCEQLRTRPPCQHGPPQLLEPRGAGSGPITDQVLTLHARAFTPGDPVVPTGRIEGVRGTPFDFTAGKPIGADLAAVGGEPVGYDHNFVVDGPAGELRPVARLEDPASGRVMTIEADQPGVQFYCGKYPRRLAAREGRQALRPVRGPLPRVAGLPERDQRARLAEPGDPRPPAGRINT